MNKKIGKIIVLSNNLEYLVLKEIMHEDVYYVLITNCNDITDTKLCSVDKDDNIEEIIDKELIKILINKFMEEKE